MKKTIWILIVIVLLVIAGAIYYAMSSPTCWPYCKDMTDQDREILKMQEFIVISSPKSNQTISSPLLVTGEARGTWYFEASFPITVVNWDGLIIGEGYAEAQGEWMTTNFVPFKGTITFIQPECPTAADYCKRGAVIFKKDNPSGLPEHDAALEIPIRFK